MDSEYLKKLFHNIITCYHLFVERKGYDIDEIYNFMLGIGKLICGANEKLWNTKEINKDGLIKNEVLDKYFMDYYEMEIEELKKEKKTFIKRKKFEDKKVNTEREVFDVECVNIYQYLRYKKVTPFIMERINIPVFNKEEENVNDIKEEEHINILEEEENEIKDSDVVDKKELDKKEEIVKKKRDERVRRLVYIYKLDKEEMLREIINEYIEDDNCDDIYASQAIFAKNEEYWLYVRMKNRIDKTKMLYGDKIKDNVGNRNNLRDFVMKKGFIYKIDRIKKKERKNDSVMEVEDEKNLTKDMKSLKK